MRMAFWILMIVLNGSDGREPTDRLIPPDWQGNPWGPVANAARENGELPPIPMTPEMCQWDAWGRQVLRDGDIVFRLGNSRLLLGYFPFSRFIANVSGSHFSHTGIVAIEDGAPYVYDTTRDGVRRQPFHIWTLDNVGPMGVKRPKPAWQSHVAGALQFCREVYETQVPFDFDFNSLDDETLYCVEMTEKAYRAAGLPLSEPVKLGDMENASEFPICMFAFLAFSDLTLDQPVFFPGNERHGIWSSPVLETIHPVDSSRSADSVTAPATQPGPSSNTARRRAG